jgi:hypothetical protein
LTTKKTLFAQAEMTESLIKLKQIAKIQLRPNSPKIQICFDYLEQYLKPIKSIEKIFMDSSKLLEIPVYPLPE